MTNYYRFYKGGVYKTHTTVVAGIYQGWKLVAYSPVQTPEGEAPTEEAMATIFVRTEEEFTQKFDRLTSEEVEKLGIDG